MKEHVPSLASLFGALKSDESAEEIIDEIKNSRTFNRSTDLDLPITYAENPDIMALAGIWKDKDISLEELRERAWEK